MAFIKEFGVIWLSRGENESEVAMVATDNNPSLSFNLVVVSCRYWVLPPEVDLLIGDLLSLKHNWDGTTIWLKALIKKWTDQFKAISNSHVQLIYLKYSVKGRFIFLNTLVSAICNSKNLLVYEVLPGECRETVLKQKWIYNSTSGSFDVVLHDGDNEIKFSLNRSYHGLCISLNCIGEN
jgi:hypothetical protein